MLRHTALAVALFATMLPASALACAMRVSPENDKLLAEILEDIDQTANQEAVAAIAPAQPVMVPPAEEAEQAEKAEPAPTRPPSVIAEVAAAEPTS